MAQNAKNMLEAFKASGSTAPVQDGTSHPKSKAKTPPPSAGGPFASAPPERGAPTPAIEEGVQSLAATQKLRYVWTTAALVAAMAIGWLVGSPREVVATERVPADPVALPEIGTSYPSTPAGDTSAASAAPRPPSGAVEAILDTTNRYTIIVATYGAGRSELAMDLVSHLQDEQFDAWPVQKGNSIFVLAEAAPKPSDLAQLVEELHAIEGPTGKPREFDDAYVVPIDDYLER